MAHLTMQELEDLGFKVVKSYTHDEFMTQRRKKGLIVIETTWLKTGKIQTQDMTIEYLGYFTFTKKELQQLDKIINRTTIN